MDELVEADRGLMLLWSDELDSRWLLWLLLLGDGSDGWKNISNSPSALWVASDTSLCAVEAALCAILWRRLPALLWYDCWPRLGMEEEVVVVLAMAETPSFGLGER